MFSLKIVDSDAFLDMPQSSQLLYFHLGMNADDDGFVSPKKIMRGIGSQDDDLKVLIAKRFVLPFDNGVVVIKHWLINNLIRKDFYQETLYLEQKKTLRIKENKAYTDDCQQNVNKLETQVRLGKDRIIPKPPVSESLSLKTHEPTEGQEILTYFSDRYFEKQGVKYKSAVPKELAIINRFLLDKENPNPKDLINFFITTPKFKEHPSVSACLSADTINLYQLKNKKKWNE